MWCVVIIYENVDYGEDGASYSTEIDKVIGPFGSKEEAEMTLNKFDLKDLRWSNLHWSSDVFEIEAP